MFLAQESNVHILNFVYAACGSAPYLTHHPLPGAAGAVTEVNPLCDSPDGVCYARRRPQNNRQPLVRGYTEFGMEFEWDPLKDAVNWSA